MKVKGVKERDVNSKFFFRVVNGRRVKNFIEELEGTFIRRFVVMETLIEKFRCLPKLVYRRKSC